MKKASPASLSDMLSLIRPHNCAMSGVASVLALYIAVGGAFFLHSPLTVVEVFLISFLFASAGNALNDYMDRDIDRTAHPHRPIPSGKIRAESARTYSFVTFAILVAWSFFLHPLAFAVVATSAVVMISYEYHLKKRGLPGNLAIGWLTGCAFLFGGGAAGRMEIVGFLALLAMLSTVGREIAKDIEDVKSDRGQRTTLPMKIGARRSSAVSGAFFLSAVALSPLPYLIGVLQTSYLLVVAVSDAIFIYSVYLLKKDVTRAQKTSKVAMLFGLIAFFVGKITM